MAVLDFFKKKGSPSDVSAPQNNPIAGDVTGSAVPSQGQDATTQTTQTVTETQSVTGGTMQGYSGIGNPPGGQAYSGIGNPPQGQAYNGIGAPPVPSVSVAPAQQQQLNNIQSIIASVTHPKVEKVAEPEAAEAGEAAEPEVIAKGKPQDTEE